MHPNRSQHGMGLISVVAIAGVMGIVMTGFLSFSKMMSKGQGNMMKVSEAISLDTTARTIMLNNSGCKMTASHWNFGILNRPQVAAIYNPVNTPVIEQGKIYNGVTVEQLQVTLFPPDGGVHLARTEMRLRKVGEFLGTPSYRFETYTNVAVSGGVVSACLESDGQGTMKLIATEQIQVNPNSVGRPCNSLVANSAGPYPWGSQCLDRIVAPPTSCSGGPNGSCPTATGPSVAVRAQGNRMKVVGTSTMGVVVISGKASFGGALYLGVQGPTTDWIGVGAATTGQIQSGHHSNQTTSFPAMLNTNKDGVYQFFLRGALGSNDFSPADAYATTWGGAAVFIEHYMVSPP